MDIIWCGVGAVIGFILGRSSAPVELSKNDEKLSAEILRLQEDVVYYKKLTKELVEENKQLRKQQ